MNEFYQLLSAASKLRFLEDKLVYGVVKPRIFGSSKLTSSFSRRFES